MPRTDDTPASKRPAKGSATASTTKARKARSKKSGAGDEVRLTGDRLVVRSTDGSERTSTGGLLIPATAAPAPKRLSWADVVLVGPDVRVASKGDRVLFLPSSALEVELEGEDLILLRERDVQAVTAADDKADRPPGQYL
jgi:chaperonin GroES